MPASYLNLSSPIKRETSTYVTADGVQFSSMLITATATCAPALLPAIGSAYELNAALQVTQADLSYGADGLGRISVTAAGPSATAKPRYQLIASGPRIYGLAPAQSGINENTARGDGGVTVEVTLVDSQSNLQTILSTYLRKVMPSSIGGLTLPAAASAPKSFDAEEPFSNGNIGSQLVRTGSYLGFICVSVRNEQHGSALLVRLSFQEAGTLAARNGQGNLETVWSFNL